MTKTHALWAATMLAAMATPANADPIPHGGTVTYSVPGTASIYQIFGHPGNPGGDYGSATDAVISTFSAGTGNVFTFGATGLVSCCSDAPNIPPDGGSSGMNITGANGLSSLAGNSNIPLVGVFTTDTDPFGGAAPAALSFDANNPLSLSPLLDQVFYIGDGHSGYNNPVGSQLSFTAPSAATRLYLGAIDAYSFGGLTGYYNDNRGSWYASVSLSRIASGVPEPATWAMMLFGFGVVGAAIRRRHKQEDGVRSSFA